MEKTVAYAVWRNPKAEHKIEIVGVPIKTLRGKATLMVRHPAFAGVRLDLSVVDFDPAAALRRFIERRQLLAEHCKRQYELATEDAQLGNALVEAGDEGVLAAVYRVEVIQ